MSKFLDWVANNTRSGRFAYQLGHQIGSAMKLLDPMYAGTQIGSALGGASNSFVNTQQAYNSAEAQRQRNWETEMSNTAIQRQVADIKAAGLNPWLAVQNGASGASTPAGASASSNSAFAEAYTLSQGMGTVVKAITSLSSSAMKVVSDLAKLAAA